MWNHCSTCNCYARAASSSGVAPRSGGRRVDPRGARGANSCRDPRRHSWGCGCCKDWDHCSSCNCYWQHDAALETDYSHILEVDVEEGIRQEAEQRARERDELGGLDVRDIFTPSPDEPQPTESSSSPSELSHGAAWRRRGREARNRRDGDIAAAVAHDESQVLEELEQALVDADQEAKKWEEHREHLQEQVDLEAGAVMQLQMELTGIFEQICQDEAGMAESVEASEAEGSEEAELIASSPEEQCAASGVDAEVCFNFYLLQASGSSTLCRRSSQQGWLRLETRQLRASMTLSAAFEASWCGGCGALDFFTIDGDSIGPDSPLGDLPLPWFIDGISVVPRRRVEGSGADSRVHGVPSSSEDAEEGPAKKACRGRKAVKNKKKKRKGKGRKGKKPRREWISAGAPFVCAQSVDSLANLKCVQKRRALHLAMWGLCLILVVLGTLQVGSRASPLQALDDSAAWGPAAPGRLGLLAPGAAWLEDRGAMSISHNGRGCGPAVGSRLGAPSASSNPKPQRSLWQRGQGPVDKAYPPVWFEGRLERGPIMGSFKPILGLGGIVRFDHCTLSKRLTSESQEREMKRGTRPAFLPGFRPKQGCLD